MTASDQELIILQRKECSMSDVIDEAKKVLEGVTSGPWSVESEGTLGAYISAGERHIAIAVDNNGDTANKSNARFIAWAREGVPALLAENAALTKRAEAAEMREKASLDRMMGALGCARGYVADVIEDMQPVGEAGRMMRRDLAMIDDALAALKGDTHE